MIIYQPVIVYKAITVNSQYLPEIQRTSDIEAYLVDKDIEHTVEYLPETEEMDVCLPCVAYEDHREITSWHVNSV